MNRCISLKSSVRVRFCLTFKNHVKEEFSMSIKSAVERARRKRTFSKNAGMTEKRVTVRTEKDQRELDALIEKQLARFVKTELSGADEMQAFSPQVREALEHALLLKGSPDFITPHGAFSTFITTLLENGLTSKLPRPSPSIPACTRPAWTMCLNQCRQRPATISADMPAARP